MVIISLWCLDLVTAAFSLLRLNLLSTENSTIRIDSEIRNDLQIPVASDYWYTDDPRQQFFCGWKYGLG